MQLFIPVLIVTTWSYISLQASSIFFFPFFFCKLTCICGWWMTKMSLNGGYFEKCCNEKKNSDFLIYMHFYIFIFISVNIKVNMPHS